MSIPGSAEPLLLAQQDTGGYQIQRSLRFNSSDSAFLSRTPASAGNRKTWTYSVWAKRSKFGTYAYLLSTGSDNTGIRFDPSTNKLELFDYPGSYAWQLVTTQVFRDPSAWYHILIALDTTQATASNRLKLYVNGTQVTTFDTSSYPSQNYEGPINNNTSQAIGLGVAGYFDGYLADVHFIDGQALTPSSFTEVSATTGRLEPKQYAGSFGTNGFWLPFSDTSSTTSGSNAGIGKDFSGNGNYWNSNNLSVTAGSGLDLLVDTPTSYGTDTGAGGDVRGNYATLNPLAGGATLSNGNLDFTCPGSSTFNNRQSRATIAIPQSGKWYWEYTVSSVGEMAVGVVDTQTSVASWYYRYDIGGFQNVKINDVQVAAIAGYTNGDIIGVGYDADNSQIRFYKNGAQVGTNYSLTNTGRLIPYVEQASGAGSCSGVTNFGQRPFAYPVSGFKALVDTNIPVVVAKPSESAFDVKLWTGNGSSQSITTSFSPDFVWIKNRNTAGIYHNLFDSVRGTGKVLFSNTTDSEVTNSAYGYLNSFDSNGFGVTVGASGGDNTNYTNWTYVGWCWDAGTTTSSNGSGSITSQVRANASAGFSVVSVPGYTYPTKTAGHGLGVEPHFIITKNRGVSNPWIIYHKAAGANTYFQFDTGSGYTGVPGVWSGVTSTVFPINSGVNQQTDIIAYCFAPVAGYSSFGSYTGNGSSDGPFVYTGFRPRWILIKNSSAAYNWDLLDTARGTYNVVGPYLAANAADAEGSYAGWDILSNGFKIRNTGASLNANGNTYIFASFAESPFAYSRAR